MGVILSEYARKAAAHCFGVSLLDGQDFDDCAALFGSGQYWEWGRCWAAELLAVPVEHGWNPELVCERIESMLERSKRLIYDVAERERIPESYFNWVLMFLGSFRDRTLPGGPFDGRNVHWPLDVMKGFCRSLPDEDLESGVEVAWRLMWLGEENPSDINMNLLKETMVRTNTPVRRKAAAKAFRNNACLEKKAWEILSMYRNDISYPRMAASWSKVMQEKQRQIRRAEASQRPTRPSSPESPAPTERELREKMAELDAEQSWADLAEAMKC